MWFFSYFCFACHPEIVGTWGAGVSGPWQVVSRKEAWAILQMVAMEFMVCSPL